MMMIMTFNIITQSYIFIPFFLLGLCPKVISEVNSLFKSKPSGEFKFITLSGASLEIQHHYTMCMSIRALLSSECLM